jgi:hypothetical protein
MHTVQLVCEALRVAEQLGYRIRQEWLGGLGGGVCEIRGRKSLFIDLTWGPAERLENLLDALRGDPATETIAMPRELRNLLAQQPQRAA